MSIIVVIISWIYHFDRARYLRLSLKCVSFFPPDQFYIQILKILLEDQVKKKTDWYICSAYQCLHLLICIENSVFRRKHKYQCKDKRGEGEECAKQLTLSTAKGISAFNSQSMWELSVWWWLIVIYITYTSIFYLDLAGIGFQFSVRTLTI